MKNHKGDEYFIDKIIADAEYIISITKGASSESFKENQMLSDSVIFRLIQISENSKRLTDAFKVMTNEIDWYEIYGMRNRLVHDYGNVDYTIVYVTATRDLPAFLQELKKIRKQISD